MLPYIPNKADDQQKMLASIGLDSIEQLFADIPAEVRLQGELKLQPPMAEMQVANRLRDLSTKNQELVCFLGAGAYDHYIPSVIDHLILRSEFFTAYTPYQPEISQGTLQAIFEYQSLICELTGMDVANASMYDGASALAEAALIAADQTRRNEIIVSKTVHPEARKVLATYLKYKGIKIVEIDDADGATSLEKLQAAVSNTTAAVLIQNPNFFGALEEVAEIEKLTHANKALLIMSVDPISLAILKSPGELGADIVVGEGQSLGNSLSFGGPYLGFMATTKKLMRRLPGRIVGQTEDIDGKRAFVLTLQAREQHIRREKATSNICSNQALNALTACIYMSTMGKQGLKEVATLSAQKAHYAYDQLVAAGYKPLFSRPFFKEFAVQSPVAPAVANQEMQKNGFSGGYALAQEYPQYQNGMTFAVTEKRSKDEIDQLVRVLGGVR